MAINALWIVIACAAGCGRIGFDQDVPASGRPEPGDPAARTYTATAAECIDPVAPDLASCLSTNGADQLVVDGRDGKTEDPWHSYLRFDLDDALAGRTIRTVRLVMTATDSDKAGGPDSGEVWSVDPFDQQSLATRVPAKRGTAPLDTSQGSVEQNDVVEWSLPIDLAVPGASIFLGVITTDQTGGVNYWNLRGVAPPRLEID